MVLNEIINEMIQEAASKGSHRQMRSPGYTVLISEYEEQETKVPKKDERCLFVLILCA